MTATLKNILSCLYCFDLLDAQLILHTCTVVSWVSWWAVTYVRIQCVVTCSTMKTRIYGKAEIGSLIDKINWKRNWKWSIYQQQSAKTEGEVFWPFEKKSGLLGKDHLGRKDRWQKRKRKTEKAMGKGHTGCFQHVCDRSWKICNWQRPFPLCGQGCNALWR